MTKPLTYLVIGYGNSLRGDDGVGQLVAEKVAQWDLPNLRSLGVHQLTPELGVEIAQVEVVIFVDAATSVEEVTVETLQPQAETGDLAHASNPHSLLLLSQVLYNHCPVAYRVLIPAVNFDFGEQLSLVTQTGMAQALREIARKIPFSA